MSPLRFMSQCIPLSDNDAVMQVFSIREKNASPHNDRAMGVIMKNGIFLNITHAYNMA